MSFIQILVILILLLASYYVLLIGKEILRKTTNEVDYTKYTEETEIDITEEELTFDVTEIDPSDIPVDDSGVKPLKNNSNGTNDGRSDNKNRGIEKNETPILPMPMDVVSFYNLVKAYNPDGPNPELETFVFQISGGSESSSEQGNDNPEISDNKDSETSNINSEAVEQTA